MIEIKTKLQKWGNSLGVVVPLEKARQAHVKEGDKVDIFMLKQKKKSALRETFGKWKFKKSVKQIMSEIDKDLYNE